MRSRMASGAIPARMWSAAALLALLLCASRAAAQRPSILVISPVGAAGGWVDLDYLSDLRRAGFEVDYTDGMADVTWERIRQYNVLVLYLCPPPPGVDSGPFTGNQPIYQADFNALIERFLQQGGGVLVMAAETLHRMFVSCVFFILPRRNQP